MEARNIVWDIMPNPGESYAEAKKRLGLPTHVGLAKSQWISEEELIEGPLDDWMEEVRASLSEEYGHEVISFDAG
jgi:hypothetical protein